MKKQTTNLNNYLNHQLNMLISFCIKLFSSAIRMIGQSVNIGSQNTREIQSQENIVMLTKLVSYFCLQIMFN